jgi:hypothetical protein
MQLQEMPVSELVGVAADKDELQRLLEGIFEEEKIHYFEPVYGAPCSVRLFSTRPTESSVQITAPLGMNAFEIADELKEFDAQARRAPKPDFLAKEAWEVRTATNLSPNCHEPRRALVLASWKVEE